MNTAIIMYLFFFYGDKFRLEKKAIDSLVGVLCGENETKSCGCFC